MPQFVRCAEPGRLDIRKSILVIGVVLCLMGCTTSTKAQRGAESGSRWVGTWATASTIAVGSGYMRPLSGTTLREIEHISAGGQQIRVRFSNEFGIDPLTISNGHIAISKGGAQIRAGSDHDLTFGGASSVRIPPGADMISDPVSMVVAPLSNVAISFYLPAQVMRGETFHRTASQSNYTANGDVAGSQSLSEASSLGSYYFLDSIDVLSVNNSRTIVAFGDSITDGGHSTRNENYRWPDDLAKRLQQVPGLGNISVLNEGLGGNRVLNEGYGPSALARFSRDVLSQDGVRYVIILEGINDIGRLFKPQEAEDNITAQQLEDGLRQIVFMAHEHGIRVIGGTITPYGGAAYYSVKGERIRQEVNDWIQTSGTFDGVVDFDKALADPANPNRINPRYDFGDHLHPNDAGDSVMAGAVDLTLFR